MKIRTPIRPVTGIEVRKTYWPHLLSVLMLWSVAMTMDFYDQKNAAEERAQHYEHELTSCLKGEWRVTTEDGEWGCLPVQLNRKEKK